MVTTAGPSHPVDFLGNLLHVGDRGREPQAAQILGRESPVSQQMPLSFFGDQARSRPMKVGMVSAM